MNPKIQKIEKEIEKTRTKLIEFQERLKSLETQKSEMENTEIVALFRSTGMNPTELADFIRQNRAMLKSAQPPQEENTEQEENQDGDE